MTSFCILTLGCKVNQAENAYIETALLGKSYKKVSIEESPDICIVNTCSVTNKSGYQSRQLIKKAAKHSKKVYVTGCYLESNSLEVKEINTSLITIKNKEKEEFFFNFPHFEINNVSVNKSTHEDRSRALVKIQEGCNSSCSYCIIPTTRGLSRSKDIGKIIDEIQELEISGFNEAVLTGIHIGYFGSDFFPKINLYDLISKEILKKTKRIKIRITSLEVRELDDRFIDLFNHPRVCSHVHVPLQSGDNEILNKMNRHYTANEYKDAIIKIYKNVKNVSIGADVIVGFPGESDIHFENTYNLIKSVPISYLHVFPFSKNSGTPAALLTNDVSDDTKKVRARKLRELSKLKKKSFMENQVGKTLEAIVEKCDEQQYVATTDNYLKAHISNYELKVKPKSLVNLLVTGVTDLRLLCKSIKKQ